MARALIVPMAKEFNDIEFFTYTPSKLRAKSLASDIGGTFCEKLSDLPKSDYYLIACKPQQLNELGVNLKKLLSSDAIILSVLAGVTLKGLKTNLGIEKVVRIMPNTPSIIQEGLAGITFDNSIIKKEKDFILSLFSSTGKVVNLSDDNDIDIITPFSGSGPAYIFEFARILINKAVDMGISEVDAKKSIIQTFLGASKLMSDSEFSPEELRNQVTSKNGVTFEALEEFKDNKLEEIFSKAIERAHNRAKELSE